MNRTRRTLALLALGTVLVVGTAQIAPGLITFHAGDTVKADEINHNFGWLDGRIDGVQDEVTALTATVDAIEIPEAIVGDVGPEGPQGPQGVQGIQGETGPMGPQGPAGQDGADGNDGRDGETGPMGLTGEDGDVAEYFGTTSFGDDGRDAADCTVGQVQLNAAGYGYGMVADGRVLSISEYEGLHSIIGSRFGGNGFSTFALPDLRAVAPKSANGAALNYFICVNGIYPER